MPFFVCAKLKMLDLIGFCKNMDKKNKQKFNSKNMEKLETKDSEKNGLFASQQPEAEIQKKETGKEESVAAPELKRERNGKIDTYIEFFLIFILGILIGIAAKTESERRITIGFDDYKMKPVQQDFDINKIQFEVNKKYMEESKNQGQEQAPQVNSSLETGE